MGQYGQTPERRAAISQEEQNLSLGLKLYRVGIPRAKLWRKEGGWRAVTYRRGRNGKKVSSKQTMNEMFSAIWQVQKTDKFSEVLWLERQ
jgi:hypothetical protein